jgi:hypothetical protein
MSTSVSSGVADRDSRRAADPTRSERRTTETKAAFKTTEFIAYIAVLAGVFIAGLAIKGGDSGTDELTANLVWLYAVILTFGYMLSRGIAKSGSRHHDHGDRY